MKNEVSIIGGGIMGMTIAMELRKKGYEISIFEASDKLGGLTKTWQIDGFTWDMFYHVILMSDKNTRNLLSTLGLEKDINWINTKTGFYMEGKLYSMSDTLEYIFFPPLDVISKIRLALTIVISSKIRNWSRLEKISVVDWLRIWSGDKVLRKIWLPLLRAKLGDNYNQTSASFIWATIQRMYAARKSGLKKESFGYMKGGYKTILEQFEKYLASLGIQIYTQHKLTSFSTENNLHTLTFKNGSEFKSSNVIFTVPSPNIITCWENMPSEEKIKHQSIQYMGVICTSVVLKKAISPYYVTNITDNWVPFTGIIEMSALVNKQNFNNYSLIYLPKYLSPEDDSFKQKDDIVHQIYTEALLKMFPHLRTDDIIEMKTARVPYVFALQTLNYSQNVPPMTSKVKGVFYCNSALITNSTLNVNETIDIAIKVCSLFQSINNG